MEARIRFTSEIYIKGKNLKEIKQKWEGIPLFSADALDNYADFIEIDCVEEENTGNDITSEFFQA